VSRVHSPKTYCMGGHSTMCQRADTLWE
jgi:hypothetical protein